MTNDAIESSSVPTCSRAALTSWSSPHSTEIIVRRATRLSYRIYQGGALHRASIATGKEVGRISKKACTAALGKRGVTLKGNYILRPKQKVCPPTSRSRLCSGRHSNTTLRNDQSQARSCSRRRPSACRRCRCPDQPRCNLHMVNL